MKYGTLLLFLFLSISLTAQTVITAGGYLDVQSGKIISPANLVIENGLISSINPKELPANAEIIDLGEKILMPGMMDMHVHLDMDYEPGVFVELLKESGSKGTIRAAKNAEKTLMAGFTTVRDVGQVHVTPELITVAVMESIDEGWVAGPRILAAGHMISITGGHADLSMGVGLAEGIMELGPEYGTVNGIDDALFATRYNLKHGAKVIKIHATAGVLSMDATVGAQQLSMEEMRAVVEEANRHGVKVAAHAHGTEGIKAAVEAGVHSIEHGSLIDEEAMRMMKEKGTYLVPTSGLTDMLLPSIDKMDSHIAEKATYVLPLAKSNLSKAIDMGVPIAMGTDAPLIPHGQNAMEIFAMVDRGMSNLQAIQSATIAPAKLLNLTDRGEIKEGLLADLIAVDANPTSNIRTLEHVTFVMKGGIVYKNQ